jgi:hypothetical protein
MKRRRLAEHRIAPMLYYEELAREGSKAMLKYSLEVRDGSYG